MPFGKLGSTLQDLNRLREILVVLAKHGLGFLVEHLQLGSYLPSKGKRRAKKPTTPVPVRVRQAFEELGPTFIKFGQILSMHPDMVPEEFVAELSKLQDNVAPFPVDEVEALLRRELGGEPKTRLRSFDRKPLAAASIAQVHRAVLPNGRQVVLKLQRPGIKKRIDADLEILRFLAETWERVGGPELPRRPQEFVEEFDRLIHAELDFKLEGRHLEHFRARFADREGYRFPAVYWDWTTAHCLTLEYLPGRKFQEVGQGWSAADKKKLAPRLIEAYILMALEDGFFHADPHTGNLLVDPEGRLCFLDAGQVGRLDSETMEAFGDMLTALVQQDTDEVVDAYLRMGTVPDDLDRRVLKREVRTFLEPFYEMPLESISIGRTFFQVVHLAVKYRIQLPPDFVVLAKTMLGAEGLARELDPTINLIRAAEPVVRRLLRRRYDPRRLAGAAYRKLREVERFFSGLPRQLQELLDKLRQGRLKIEFEHRGLEELRHALDHASNRVAFALITAALIVGSSLIVTSQIGPRYENLPLFGIIGFLLAGLLGLWLIISILRSGRF